MPALFSNTASADLSASISATATVITVAAGQGAVFPTVPAGSFFYATLTDSSNNLEIVKVTGRTADTLTVTRAQEGTSALAYAAGDKIELRLTAAVMNNLVQLDGAQAITGNKSFSGDVAFTGQVTATGPTIYSSTASLVLPLAAVPAQTTSGSAVWDSVTKELTIGTGTGRNTLVDTTTAQTIQDKTLQNSSLGLAGKELTTTSFTIKEVAGVLLFQTPTTAVTASINTTTMTVSSGAVGSVQPGQTLTGTGVSANSTVINQVTSNEAATATPTLASGGAAGTSSFVVSSAAGIAVGQLVTGTGLPTGTYVAATYVSGTTIPLVDYLGTPMAFTSAGSGTYTFSPAGGRGTYTVSPSQTVAPTSMSGVITVASLSRAGEFKTRTSVTSGAPL